MVWIVRLLGEVESVEDLLCWVMLVALECCRKGPMLRPWCAYVRSKWCLLGIQGAARTGGQRIAIVNWQWFAFELGTF